MKRILTIISAQLMTVVAALGQVNPPPQPTSHPVAQQAVENPAEINPAEGTKVLLDEQGLIERIKLVGQIRRTNISLETQLEILGPPLIEAVQRVDELLTRFPETKFREEAILIRLGALSELSRARPEYLAELTEFTAALIRSKPGAKLESEAAFYAIQAFTLGARAEEMPEERRLQGATERYRAFLLDYPNSERRPVIRASLVRNLIALKQLDEAEIELEKLKRAHPNESPTHRAEGEVRLARSIGKPFKLSFEDRSGAKIDTANFLGKVIVVHFWATFSERAVKELPVLLTLHEKHRDAGLVLLGISADKSSKAFQNQVSASGMTWPQYFDGKGIENLMVVRYGVATFPTYFLVDRRGILREVSRGADLERAVEMLVQEE